MGNKSSDISHRPQMDEYNDRAGIISVLPEGCISDILSLTSPRDASRAAAISKTFNTAADSDAVWEQFLPPDYRQVIARAVSPVNDFETKKELYMYLSDSHVLLDRGTLGFKLDKDSGKKCYMLGARDLSIAWHDDTRYWERGHVPESRFAEVAILREGKITKYAEHTWLHWALILRVPINSTNVYKVDSVGLAVPAKTTVIFGGIRNETSNVYLKQPRAYAHDEPPTNAAPTTRKDGWMEIELGEFYGDDGDEGKVEMKFQEHDSWKGGLIVEGIELRPK
ncbi:F-box domain, Phloem protein 2-like protein [Artemisia annua]|uniref:F-box domain, Phloem protein 2-like protein n=1 Tax=Artemisia annua TaxID=35608 RepID=A0A2U1NLU0_ARTAN|nr:F-box domain, Phloem protein 2-like protein [Artemisia annua]